MVSADGVESYPEQTAAYLLVYSPKADTTAWWARWVDKDFAHVEIWWAIGGGYYTATRPYHHFLIVDIMQGDPPGRVQSVLAKRDATRAMIPFGLKTCVSVAKAMLGIRAAWVVTPRQLYNYVEKRGGVV